MSTFAFSYYDRANYEVFWRALSLSLVCIKLTMKMEAEKLLFVFGTVLKRLNSFLLSVDDHTTVNECKVTSSCSPSSPSSSPSSPSSSPSLPSSSPSSTWALITTPIDARSPHNFGPQTLHNVWRWTKIAIDRHWPLYNCHQFPFGVMWLQQCNDNVILFTCITECERILYWCNCSNNCNWCNCESKKGWCNCYSSDIPCSSLPCTLLVYFHSSFASTRPPLWLGPSPPTAEK